MKLVFDKFSPFLGVNMMETSSGSPGCFKGNFVSTLLDDEKRATTVHVAFISLY